MADETRRRIINGHFVSEAGEKTHFPAAGRRSRETEDGTTTEVIKDDFESSIGAERVSRDEVGRLLGRQKRRAGSIQDQVAISRLPTGENGLGEVDLLLHEEAAGQVASHEVVETEILVLGTFSRFVLEILVRIFHFGRHLENYSISKTKREKLTRKI